MTPDEEAATDVDPVVAGLALSRYVAVYAATSEGFPLDDVLAHEDLDPAGWASIDAAWARRMMESAEGDLALIDEHDRRLVAAQDRLARRVAPLDDDLRAWLDFYRAWTTDPDPLGKLAAWKLGKGDVFRIHRRWSARLEQDEALRAEASAILQEPAGAVPPLDIAPLRLPPSTAIRAAAARPPLAAPPAPEAEPVWPGLDVDLPGTAASEPVRRAPVRAPVMAPPPMATPPLAAPVMAPPRIFAPAMAPPPPPVAAPVMAPPPPPPSSPVPAPKPSLGETSTWTPSVILAALPFRKAPPAPAATRSAPIASPAPAAALLPRPTPPPRPAAPVLTLAQYACLCAELATSPATSEETFARYGLVAPPHRIAVDLLWKERLRRDPVQRAEWERHYQHYRAYLADPTRQPR